MPLSGGKYVAPHWVNNAAPALDAAELQAMCDTIVKNQRGVETAQGLISGKAQVQVVSYVGTGTWGAGNPCSITFRFAPKIVLALTHNYRSYNGVHYWSSISNFPETVLTMVQASAFTAEYSYTAAFSSSTSNRENYFGKKSSDGRTFSWYCVSNSPEYFFNRVGVEYCFVGIG